MRWWSMITDFPSCCGDMVTNQSARSSAKTARARGFEVSRPAKWQLPQWRLRIERACSAVTSGCVAVAPAGSPWGHPHRHATNKDKDRIRQLCQPPALGAMRRAEDGLCSGAQGWDPGTVPRQVCQWRTPPITWAQVRGVEWLYGQQTVGRLLKNAPRLCSGGPCGRRRAAPCRRNGRASSPAAGTCPAAAELFFNSLSGDGLFPRPQHVAAHCWLAVGNGGQVHDQQRAFAPAPWAPDRLLAVAG